MDKKKKDTARDIVKDIFERPSAVPEKVSTIFSRQKITSPSQDKTKESRFSPQLPAGIDIGASSVKIVQLARTKNKGEPEIIAVDSESYPRDQKFSLPVYQREALKKIIERNHIGPEVFASLPLKSVQIYNFTFPPMSDPELEEAIQWKIANLKPSGLNIATSIYNFIRWEDPLGQPPHQQKVLLVCVAKEVVQERIALLQEVGLKPLSIQVAPFSLLNLDKFRKAGLVKDEVVMWVILGEEESTLMISRSGILYFCRKLTFTSRHMTRQIAQHYNLPEAEAERLKKDYGLIFWGSGEQKAFVSQQSQPAQKPKDKEAMVYYSLISSLENLVVDIEHSFKYFSYELTQSRVTKFDRLILAGGGANLKNLENFLSERLGVMAQKVDIFSLFGVSGGLKGQVRGLLEGSCALAPSAGLAATPENDEERQINLLPEAIKKKKWEKPLRTALAATGIAVMTIVVMTARVVSLHLKMDSAAEEVRVAQEQLGHLQAQQLDLAEQEADLWNQKELLKAQLGLLDQSVRTPEDFSRVLNDMAGLIPKEIWLTELSYSERQLTIAGSASDMQAIMNFVERLKTSDDFGSVTFNQSQKKSDSTLYDFDVVTRLLVK